MPIVLIVVLVLIVVFVIGGISSYNRFVSQRNLIKDAWANIDTELRRRYDLIPNLVSTVQGYATHEREVFENVTKARAMATSATGSPAAQAAAEGPFVAALRQLLAVAENYPRPEGERELPGAAVGAVEHRGPAADGPALLQRQRARVQPARPVVPVDDRRELRALRARGVLRGRRVAARRRGGAEGRLLVAVGRRRRRPRRSRGLRTAPAGAAGGRRAPPPPRRRPSYSAPGGGRSDGVAGRRAVGRPRRAARAGPRGSAATRCRPRPARSPPTIITAPRGPDLVGQGRGDQARDAERQRDQREVERRRSGRGCGRAPTAGARSSTAPIASRRRGARRGSRRAASQSAGATPSSA